MMENRDYKYIIQDTGNLYIGARYSYAELLQDEDIPFKVKAICKRYILTEMDPEDTLESHFYYMDHAHFDYQTYKQLKARIKVSILTEKKGWFGKTSRSYQDKIYPLDAFVKMSPAMKEANGIMIQEIILSKLSLMTFSV